MNARIEYELLPFDVPDFVRIKLPPRPREEGYVETPKVALSDLDAETLGKLCDEFRLAVFVKARKLPGQAPAPANHPLGFPT